MSTDGAMPTTDEMLALARSREPADRERLLGVVIDLCQRGVVLSPEGGKLVQDIFLSLAARAESDIRARLAQKLADASWAPRALVCMLAVDEIEIARPLIEQSPVLGEPDLIRLVVEATLEHRVAVARRPYLTEGVAHAIVEHGEPSVMTALAGNDTASIAAADMRQLVEASRRIAALRGPLARHPRLTQELAESLYGWVGEALRANIASRFAIDPGRLQETVRDAVAEAMGDGAGQSPEDQAELEQRLIAKLQAAGQLRPGYLIRALREGRLGLFRAALAVLGDYGPETVERAVASGREDLLALACAGVGIDRSVFPTIQTLVQQLAQTEPTGSAAETRRVADAFALRPELAAEAFRAAIQRI